MSTRQVVFSYTTTAAPSAAYDTTRVSSPEPIFRKVINIVGVHFVYTGPPATVHVAALLSTASGWHSSVPLAGATTFAADKYVGTVLLDLAALQARADAAVLATGLAASQVNVAVQPIFTTKSGQTFTPDLNLVLTPAQLTLAGAPSTLKVSDATTSVITSQAKNRTVTLAGHKVLASKVRLVALAILGLSLLSGLLILLLARAGRNTSEGAAIRRRYGAIMVPVEPIISAPGRPIVDVPAIGTLIKLAERYRLLVLHWERSGVETFVVLDENTTYRYRAGAAGPVQETTTTSPSEKVHWKQLPQS